MQRLLENSIIGFVPMAILAACGLISRPAGLDAADWPQWRGAQRDGMSSETGLLAEWPPEGPKLAGRFTDCGTGYSTPAVVGGRLFALGNEGLEDEFVFALALPDGRQAWRTRLGKVGQPKQDPNFPAARSTPTVDGEWLYALGSDGDLACLATATGEVRWRRNLRADFGGKPGTWAYAESPLIDGDALICTPGGSQATILALNKRSGEAIWKSAVPGGDDAAYTSAIRIEAGGTLQYVQMLQKGLVGVEARSGQLLWRYDRTASRFNANIPTPLAHDGCIYSAGAGTGGGLIRLRAQGASIEYEPVYFSPKLPSAIGGVVKVGDYLYGTGSQSMLCVEWKTGEVKWEERALGPASLCFADGRLYLHGEGGEVALVAPTPAGYREKGRFTPPDPPRRSHPMEKAWAYPVVAHGRLYIRDHRQIWCYDVMAASANP